MRLHKIKTSICIVIVTLFLLTGITDVNTKAYDCLDEDIHIYIRGGFNSYHLIVTNYGNDTVNAYFNVILKSIFTHEISIDSGEFDAGPQLITEFGANSPYFFSYIQANLSVCGKTLTRSGFVIMKFIIFTSTEFYEVV